jgi:uncharacterized membrane protein YhaH (DUF805 family)
MKWYFQVLSKYAVFSGRARRSEYWYFVLFNALITPVIYLISIPLLGIPAILYSLAVFIPAMAVGVRRLHDTGRSGWNLLLALIPLIGAIILLVYFFQDSAVGENKYGVNTK